MSAPPPHLDAFLDASTVGERTRALADLMRALRHLDAGAHEARSGLGALLDLLEERPELRERFVAALVAFLSETDSTILLGETGVPSDRGFLAELGDRLSARLVPTPRDDRDLSHLVARLFRTSGDVEAFRLLPLADVHRLLRFAATALPAEVVRSLSNTFADGFRLLLARLQAQGLSGDLRARSTPVPVSDSPFHRISRSGDALLTAWLSGGDVAAAADAFRRDSGECRKETRVIQRHLEDAGVSVDVVFGLEVIDRCLTRTAMMADFLAAPDGPERSRLLHKLLARLALFAHEERSVTHLVRWNLHLLDRKIVDRSGRTGEHYVAASRREYGHIWIAAAGGGALTVFTAAIKMLVHSWHLSPFPEGFLYGLNYAVSFLLLQAFGLVLATKQPAMTAAALANIVRDAQGDDREERIAGFFSRLASSQIAAAVSNVLVVGIGATLFDLSWRALRGRPYLDPEDARHTFETLSPLDSGTVFFAALTGVLLWLGSLAGGWFENWTTYHRIPDGIAQHPLGERVGRARMERLGAALARNASGWGTNVALGFLLGFAPAVGRFFGIPFDVRHVTLSTGTLALAAAGLGEEWYGGGTFLRGLAGIGVMFVLNLSVAFGLSLVNAARAYEMPPGELAGVLRHVVTRAVRRPLDFLRPPRRETETAG